MKETVAILFIIFIAFTAGMIVGGTIAERAAKQYYEEEGDVNRINHRAVYRLMGGDAADVHVSFQAEQGSRGGGNK